VTGAAHLPYQQISGIRQHRHPGIADQGKRAARLKGFDKGFNLALLVVLVQ